MSTGRPLAAVLVAGAALAASGCAASADSSATSVSFPEPDRQAVAAAVGDIADAARARDYAQICADYLAEPLVRRLDDAKATERCPEQIELSLRDVDQTGLAVRDVRLSGGNAVAVVQPSESDDAGERARLIFVKEGPRWKLSGVG